MASTTASAAGNKSKSKGSEKKHEHHHKHRDDDEDESRDNVPLERDAECTHCGNAVYAPLQSKINENPGEPVAKKNANPAAQDYYVGEWESCAKCDKPVCGTCISQGKCGYRAIPDYAPPMVYIQAYCPRMHHRACHPRKT